MTDRHQPSSLRKTTFTWVAPCQPNEVTQPNPPNEANSTERAETASQEFR